METYYKSDFTITDNIGVDLSALDFDIVYYTSAGKKYIVSKRGSVCLRCALDTDDTRRLEVRFVKHGLRPGILSREILFLASSIGLDPDINMAAAANKRQYAVGSDGEKVRLVLLPEPAKTDGGQNNANPLQVMEAEIKQAERDITSLTTMVASLRAGMSSGNGNIDALLDRMGNAEGKLVTNTADIASLKTRVSALENAVSDLTARVNALEGHITGIEFANAIPHITTEDSYDYSANVIPSDTIDDYTLYYDIESVSADSREESANMVILHYIALEQETVLTLNTSTGEIRIIGTVGVSDTIKVTATAMVGEVAVATAEQNTEISIN